MTGEWRSADELQEREDTGGQGAPSRYVAQDATVESICGVASVREAVPCDLGLMWAGHLWMDQAMVRWVSRVSGPLGPLTSPLVQCKSLPVRKKVSGGPMVVVRMWQCRTGFG